MKRLIAFFFTSMVAISQPVNSLFDVSTLSPQQQVMANQYLAQKYPLGIPGGHAVNQPVRNTLSDDDDHNRPMPLSRIEALYEGVSVEDTVNVLIDPNHPNPEGKGVDPLTTDENMDERQDTQSEIQSAALTQYGYAFLSNNLMGISNFLADATVPSDYQLGPGDALTIFLFGKREEVFDVVVDNASDVFIPGVGPVHLGHLTLSDAEEILKKKLSARYTNFNLKLQLKATRTLPVFIGGDVATPGVYSVRRFDSIIRVLAMANGVQKSGSLRSIQIIRKGRVHQVVDLYDVFFNGRHQTVNFESNDMIFIPKLGGTIAVNGEVNGPGIFEIKPKETMKDALRYAAGFSIQAFKQSLVVSRIDANYGRRVIAVHANSNKQFLRQLGQQVVSDGDYLYVKPRSHDVRGYVSVTGNVTIPGRYAYKKGMTFGDVLALCGGVKVNSHQTVQVYRYLNDDQRELVRFSIDDVDVVMTDRDVVRVFNDYHVGDHRPVNVVGEVQHTGSYQHLPGMTLSDLLLLAQPTYRASLQQVEVARHEFESSRAHIEYVNAEETTHFLLQPGDRVSIKRNQYVDAIVTVQLVGEVVFPGTYRVPKGTRLSEVVRAAGGYTEHAFLDGAVFTRRMVEGYDQFAQQQVIDDETKRLIYDQSHMSNLSMDTEVSMGVMMTARKEALTYLSTKVNQYSGRVIVDLNPDTYVAANSDFVIEDGDQLMITTIPESVHLVGGVQAGISLAYNASFELHDYVNHVGGYSTYADRHNVYIFKASGRVLHNVHDIDPGDIIYVPEKVHIRVNWLQFLTNITSIISNAVTSIVLVKSLN